jgi:hypothetical protein
MRFQARPLAERMESMTCPEPNTGCLLWTGPTVGTKPNRTYGKVTVGSRRTGDMKTMLAHRAAWALANGWLPCAPIDVRRVRWRHVP